MLNEKLSWKVSKISPVIQLLNRKARRYWKSKQDSSR